MAVKLGTVATIVLILAALAAPAANAEPTATDVQNAQAWWATQGITGCPDGIDLYIWPDPVDGANGWAGGCFVVLLKVPVYDGGIPVADGWDYGCGGYLQNFMRHEVGHALGLTHPDMERFPVMNPTPAVESICPPSAWEVKQRRKVRASVPKPRMHMRVGQGRLGKHRTRAGRWRGSGPIVTGGTYG